MNVQYSNKKACGDEPIVIVDFQSSEFIHSDFNAAVLKVLHQCSVTYVKKSHKQYLAKMVSDRVTIRILHEVDSSSHLFSRVGGLTSMIRFIGELNAGRVLVVLSLSLPQLLILMCARGRLKGLLVFIHSLDSVVARSCIRRSLLRVASLLSFSDTPAIFISNGGSPARNIEALYKGDRNVSWSRVPHPIPCKTTELLKHTSELKQRRFLFLGEIRPEKRFEDYVSIAILDNSKFRPFHVTNGIEISHEIPVLVPTDGLTDVVGTRDIVFAAYDQTKYSSAESGTFWDAVGARAWVLVGLQQMVDLRRRYPGAIRSLELGAFALIKFKPLHVTALNRDFEFALREALDRAVGNG